MQIAEINKARLIGITSQVIRTGTLTPYVDPKGNRGVKLQRPGVTITITKGG